MAVIQVDGTLPAAPLFDIADTLGVTDKAIRDCLARLVRSELLVKAGGRGRGAIYTTTPAAQAGIAADLAWTGFAHRLDGGLATWDGSWHMLSFEIAEQHRSARDTLRNALLELGAAPLHGGVYVSAWELWPFVEPIVAETGTEESVVRWSAPQLVVGATSSPAEVAARVWPLSTLAEQYRAMEVDLSTLADEIDELDDAEVAGRTFDLTARLDPLVRSDPLLPLPLVPPDWPAPRVRRRYLDLLARAGSRSNVVASSLYATRFSTEIDQALEDDELQFWARWLPSLLDAARLSVPEAARRSTGRTTP